MTTSTILEIDITGIAFGGSAVGRHEGKTIFVSGALPGERIRIRILQDKKRYALAELIEIIQPVPERIAPVCKHFGVCGGCQWQHIDYSAQLLYKQQIVADQFRRIGGFQNAPILSIIPSPEPLHYRSHITMHAEDEVGFIGIDNETIIPIEECYIIRPELLERVPEVQARSGRVRLHVGDDGHAVIEDETSDTVITHTVNGRRFQVSAGSFFQVNHAQAEKLVKLVIERLQRPLENTPLAQQTVLDLYSGVGLFTAFIAEKAARVIAAEIYAPAVKDARVNLRGFDNVAFHTAAIEALLPSLSGRIDAVVLDPPRAGVKPAALDTLAGLHPKRIVYVSCDPATLARDTKQLVESGYTLREVQPLDMFPQTYHIEAIATLER